MNVEEEIKKKEEEIMDLRKKEREQDEKEYNEELKEKKEKALKLIKKLEDFSDKEKIEWFDKAYTLAKDELEEFFECPESWEDSRSDIDNGFYEFVTDIIENEEVNKMRNSLY